MRRWLVVAMVLVVGTLGCSPAIESTPDGLPDPGSATVTWYEHVLPVVYDNCVMCHQEGGIGFSMDTYDEALAARAPAMAQETASANMPPWQPASDCNSFIGERRLTQAEKDIFAAWSIAGAPAGDPGKAPSPPAGIGGLEDIDAEVSMAQAYTPSSAGDGNDLRCFVLDPQLSQDAVMIGFDIKPGEKQVVHHVLLYSVDAAAAAALDEADSGYGYSCPGGPGVADARVMGGWVPGMPPIEYPQGTGLALEAVRVLVLQIHYNTTTAGPLPDQTTVQLKFAAGPVPKVATLVSIADHEFAIPPLSKGYSTTATLKPKGKLQVWAAAPHMHLLGRRALVELERAGGSECLIDIPDWDFNWQQFYFFTDPVDLSKGDQLNYSCTWDNPTAAEVSWGDDTEDEMCIAYFYVTAGD